MQMYMRKKLIAANWKMYKTPQQAREFVAQFLPLVRGHDRDEIVLCPSSVRPCPDACPSMHRPRRTGTQMTDTVQSHRDRAREPAAEIAPRTRAPAAVFCTSSSWRQSVFYAYTSALVTIVPAPLFNESISLLPRDIRCVSAHGTKQSAPA